MRLLLVANKVFFSNHAVMLTEVVHIIALKTQMVVAVKRTGCTPEEVRLLALVSHRHIIKMFGAYVDDPMTSFIVTE